MIWPEITAASLIWLYIGQSIKRRTRPMPGFKTFRCARILLVGIELIHVIAQWQMQCTRGTHPANADRFFGIHT